MVCPVRHNTYGQSLQNNEPHPGEEGLQSLFKSLFPVFDPQRRASLEFIDYEIEEPDFGFSDSINMETTYAGNLVVSFQLISWEYEKREKLVITDIVEQSLIFGDLPFMTMNGTFVIDGIECAPRSPGLEGELMKNYYGAGLQQVCIDASNKMKMVENFFGIFPYDILNAIPFSDAVKEFKNTLQLVRHREH